MRCTVHGIVRQLGGLGGGFGRLPLLVIAATLVSFAALAAPADPPTSQGGLISQVKQAIENGDFETIEKLVLWTDVSPYKRRVIASQIRHSLGRPIQSIALEEADIETRRELQNLRNLRLNLPVSDLLRVTFNDADGSADEPATVFLIGKLDGAYRIALLVRKAPPKDDD